MVSGLRRLPTGRPKTVLPQQRTVPLASNAQVWNDPDAIATAVVMPVTATGMRLSTPAAPMPLPSCPLSLVPQQRTVPSNSSAHEKLAPAVTATAVGRSVTSTGTITRASVLVPLPSCPTLLEPQQRTVPSSLTWQVWTLPAEIRAAGSLRTVSARKRALVAASVAVGLHSCNKMAAAPIPIPMTFMIAVSVFWLVVTQRARVFDLRRKNPALTCPIG